MQKIQVGDKRFELFLGITAIAGRIDLLAKQLNKDYKTKKPIYIGTLNGSFIFMADLFKKIKGTCEITFTKVSAYKGVQNAGQITTQLALPNDLAHREVILVEDIIDTGITLKYLLEKIYAQNPASVAVCSLLLKPQAVKYHFNELKYVGFEIPNEFMVGYGLDYEGLGRNLCGIYRPVN